MQQQNLPDTATAPVRRRYLKTSDWRTVGGYRVFEETLQEVTAPYGRANLIGSRTTNGWHAPLFDIDQSAELLTRGDHTEVVIHSTCRGRHFRKLAAALCNAELSELLPAGILRDSVVPIPLLFNVPVRLRPSKTAGHFHLYVDYEVPWSAYAAILRAGAKARVFDPDWVKLSLKRSESFLRIS
jgi:hypothetical protein